jgi:hypothetical protein
MTLQEQPCIVCTQGLPGAFPEQISCEPLELDPAGLSGSRPFWLQCHPCRRESLAQPWGHWFPCCCRCRCSSQPCRSEGEPLQLESATHGDPAWLPCRLQQPAQLAAPLRTQRLPFPLQLAGVAPRRLPLALPSPWPCLPAAPSPEPMWLHSARPCAVTAATSTPAPWPQPPHTVMAMRGAWRAYRQTHSHCSQASCWAGHHNRLPLLPPCTARQRCPRPSVRS